VKGESNRAGLHAKIAEPNPIFYKDREIPAIVGLCLVYNIFEYDPVGAIFIK
jgi:hypothetical protein